MGYYKKFPHFLVLNVEEASQGQKSSYPIHLLVIFSKLLQVKAFRQEKNIADIVW